MGHEAAAYGSYRSGALKVLPLAVAIAVLGVVFGFVARNAGLGVVASIAMSATTFAGSPQFAAISVFSSHGSLLAAVVAAAALAARFGAMSVTAAPALGGALWKRLLLSQLVVDETWAIAYRRGRGFDRRLLIGAGLALYIVHTTATAVGAVLGNFVGAPERWGIDAVSPALFVVLIAPHLAGREAWIAVVLAAGVTLATVPVSPPGVALVLAIATVVAFSVFAGSRHAKSSR